MVIKCVFMWSQHIFVLLRAVSADQTLPRFLICQIIFTKYLAAVVCLERARSPKIGLEICTREVLFLFDFLQKQQLCFILICFSIRQEFHSHQCGISDTYVCGTFVWALCLRRYTCHCETRISEIVWFHLVFTKKTLPEFIWGLFIFPARFKEKHFKLSDKQRTRWSLVSLLICQPPGKCFGSHHYLYAPAPLAVSAFGLHNTLCWGRTTAGCSDLGGCPYALGAQLESFLLIHHHWLQFYSPWWFLDGLAQDSAVDSQLFEQFNGGCCNKALAANFSCSPALLFCISCSSAYHRPRFASSIASSLFILQCGQSAGPGLVLKWWWLFLVELWAPGLSPSIFQVPSGCPVPVFFELNSFVRVHPVRMCKVNS